MKARSIIVVLVTLIIGFILGMLTSAQIRYHKLKPVRVFFSEERFRDGFYRTIQPDDQQKTKIDLVLDKYAKINSELQNNFRKELDASMKDFRKELDLNLTKDQIARLKEMDARREEMIRYNRKNHEDDTINMRDGRPHKPDGRPSPEGPPPHPFPGHDTTRLPDIK
jgi:recombinational DNA repair protein RecT